MKSVIIDTSSAILLYKSKLISHLIDQYRTLITPSVQYELTQDGYPGSIEFRRLCEKKHIHVLPEQCPINTHQSSSPELPVLNPGEKDTIRQQIHGAADFIIIDDGRAVKYCRKAALPFINALLFPRILFLAKVISESDFHQKWDQILQHGRYSDHIISMALDLSPQAIQPFLPTPI